MTDTASPDFIGPLKPAYVTMKKERFLAQAAKANGGTWSMPKLLAWGAEAGILDLYETIVEFNQSGDPEDPRIRLTFRDDWSAAEFALRYA